MDLELIRRLITTNKRVFTTQEAREVGQEIGIDPDSIRQYLHMLKKKEAIHSLTQGLYHLAPEFLTGIPIHEYETATALTSPSTIAFLSAMHYHHLTDQISRIIYVLGTLSPSTKMSYSTYRINGVK